MKDKEITKSSVAKRIGMVLIVLGIFMLASVIASDFLYEKSGGIVTSASRLRSSKIESSISRKNNSARTVYRQDLVVEVDKKEITLEDFEVSYPGYEEGEEITLWESRISSVGLVDHKEGGSSIVISVTAIIFGIVFIGLGLKGDKKNGRENDIDKESY